MTVHEIESNAAYYLHHTASRRGYVSRKSSGTVEPYSGKFGTGYVVISPRYDTTQYVNIAYYIAR